MKFEQKHLKHKTWNTVAIDYAGKIVAKIYQCRGKYRVDISGTFQDFHSYTLAESYCRNYLYYKQLN